MSYPSLKTIFGACLLLVAGCAVYHAKRLPTRDDLATQLPATTSDFSSSHQSPANSVPIGMDQIAVLAVLNSPDIKSARAQAGVSWAQAFAAGLLPDPQLSASLDHPTDHMLGLVNAYGLGAAFDLQSWLTAIPQTRAIHATQEQARLDLSWAEWQTVERAKDLYVQKAIADERVGFLQTLAPALTQQAEAASRAFQNHDLTPDEADALMSASSDLEAQLASARQAALKANTDLQTLLNVAPSISLDLSDPGDPAIASEEELRVALADVARRRPDLLALEAGYRSQNAELIKDVLKQFPAISVGFNKARDTSAVHSVGPSITLSLPLFERGRGDIAVANATRDQLWQEYQTRLDGTVHDAWQLLHQSDLDRSRLTALLGRMPQLNQAVTSGREALLKGDLSPATYVTIVGAYVARRLEMLEAKQSLWTSSLALESTLGHVPDVLRTSEARE